MLNAFALLALLLTPEPAPSPDVCELTHATSTTASSRSCLGCHDGSIGSAADVTVISTLEEFATTGLDEGSHPVDVDYAQAALRRPGTLAPIGSLPPELALSAGLVTCTTCHNRYSLERFRVSMTQAGSTLCLACHLY